MAARKKKPTPSKKATPSQSGQLVPRPEDDFAEVVALIAAARARAAVNHELVSLYWQVGEYISRKIESAAWGNGVVESLAAHITRRHPTVRDFNGPNLFRMRQYHEA